MAAPVQLTHPVHQLRYRPRHGHAGRDLPDGQRPHRRLRYAQLSEPAVSWADEATYTMRPSPTHVCAAAAHIGQCSPEV
ncbi:hypothetical protein BIV25_33380 [Streptomyces sp. MUSC 14]|nr:hypothetical protein BIV25_33380 [Streptomyces sp. MUSC 14]